MFEGQARRLLKQKKPQKTEQAGSIFENNEKKAAKKVRKECHRRHMLLTQKSARTRITGAKARLYLYNIEGRHQLKVVQKYLGMKRIRFKKVFDAHVPWPRLVIQDGIPVVVVRIVKPREGEVSNKHRVQCRLYKV